jgi:acyl-CoA-dependent ceramide synthase
MFGHHLLTIALITTSYATHFTRVGTVIHALMDFCDILLPVSLLQNHLVVC